MSSCHGAGEHGNDPVGDVLLDEQDAGGRAALTGAVEGRRKHVADRLLGQRRGIDDHGIHAAGLGDQRDDRTAALRQRPVDQVGGLVGTGEGDAVDPGIGQKLPADAGPVARQQLPGRRPECRRGAAGSTAWNATSGVCSAGLAITALPAARAAATCPVKIASGKFQGLMQAKTPRPAQAQLVALAGRARKRHRSGKLGARQLGVIAQEIDGLPKVGHARSRGSCRPRAPRGRQGAACPPRRDRRPPRESRRGQGRRGDPSRRRRRWSRRAPPRSQLRSPPPPRPRSRNGHRERSPGAAPCPASPPRRPADRRPGDRIWRVSGCPRSAVRGSGGPTAAGRG